MTKATKLPSGNWRCLAYYTDATGRHKKSFTARTRKGAESLAAEFMEERHRLGGLDAMQTISFYDASVGYTDSRKQIISPVSYREYMRTANAIPKSFSSKLICDITRQDVQHLINQYSKDHAPKSVANLHGFISSVFKMYRPDYVLNTLLPRAKESDLYMPTEEEVKVLLEAVKGTEMEIPVMLAALGSLRRSEVCALDISDVGDGYVNVTKAMVMDENRQWVLKDTKTAAGTRTTYLPKQATDRIRSLVKEGPVCPLSPTVVTHRFSKILDKLGLPHFRFHALRGFYASVMHSLNIPERYIMEAGGWKDVGTMRKHYQRAMKDKIPEIAKIGTDHFEKLL